MKSENEIAIGKTETEDISESMVTTANNRLKKASKTVINSDKYGQLLAKNGRSRKYIKLHS